MTRRFVIVFPLLGFLALSACGGGSPQNSASGGPGQIHGYVTKAPVGGATVNVYQLAPDLSRQAVLASATTASDGSFSVTVPPYNGAIELGVTGGTYLDEVRRTSSNLPLTVTLSRELTYVIPAYTAGSSWAVTVSPVSHIVRSLAGAKAAAQGLPAAVSSAWTCMNRHFGGVQWQDVQPLDIAATTAAADVADPRTKAGLILAAFSQLGMTLAPSSMNVTGITLADAVAQDAKDGVLDGKLNGTQLTTGNGASPDLSSYTMRTDLAQAVFDYVKPGSANPSLLTATDVYSLAAALALDGDACAFPASAPPNADTSAPAPQIASAPPGSYLDERSMTLAGVAAGPSYAFPPAQVKAVVTNGSQVYKTSARLSGATGLTVAQLRTSNPSNLPFLEILVPRGPAAAPLVSVTYEVTDGVSTFSADLTPWAVEPGVYDLPLAAAVGAVNVIPFLSTATASPLTLAFKVTATDAAGKTSGSVPVGGVTFHVMAPPLFVEEDVNYPSIGAPSSTYAYSLIGANFNALWSTSNTAFLANEVRLVRYVISNPYPFPVGVRGAFDLGGGSGWTMNETWKRFTTSVAGTPFLTADTTYDGFSFAPTYYECIFMGGANACTSLFAPLVRNPYPSITPYPFSHVVGDTGTKFVSNYPLTPLPDYSNTAVAFPVVGASDTGVRTSFFATSGGVEATRPTMAGAYAAVPAASGSSPGTLTAYVVRPFSANRTYSTLAWNAFTPGNRFEAMERLVYFFAGSYYNSTYGFTVYWYISYLGGVTLQAAQEKLAGTLTFTGRTLNGVVQTGEEATTFSQDVTRVLVNH